jgi:ppGpp synthetase/RelA/SpoT-type nucleotidyltranferase
MNFDGYEKNDQVLYAEFAGIVRFILEQAIAAAGAPRPQSIQHRAKSAASLKPKLEARGLLSSDSIEKEIKDLAGVRLIFYTNTDVDRFLNSRLIPRGFEVDWKETRIHHPTTENAQQRYQAIHYTVFLSAERIALPEYAKFKGIRCEIQIQTILNHAWAETSHDILYKTPESQGFGSRAFQSIEKRMTRVMDEYLLPAGYELQKVQHDFERLMQGKALFDRGTLEALVQCDNNNDRHDTLSTIREYVLPNYDDVQGIYTELCQALVDAVRLARASAPKPIESAFGTLSGKTAEDVTTLALDILDDLRYADVERTFHSLAEIYGAVPEKDVRKHILQVVEHLTSYNINVWERVGPAVQYALAEMIAGMNPEDRRILRPLVLTVWRALLVPQMRGTSSPSVDTITISTGAVPASDALATIRDRAISGLLELWDQSSSMAQQREVFSALMEGTQTPTQNYSNKLCALILKDATRIVDSMTDRLADKSYELLEHIEHQLLFQYHRAQDLAKDEQDRFGCKEVATNLMTSVLAIRDRLNADTRYVRYKTLVGFEAVLPPHWEDENFEFDGVDQFRRERATEFVGAISDATEEEWYQVVVRCAATESEDLATFPIFGDFLVQFAKAKPATAIRFLRKEDAGVLNFLPAFLNGLSQSDADSDYRALLAGYLSEGKHLSAIARHFRTTKSAAPASVREVLDKAIGANDDVAVIECLVLAVEQHDPQKRPLVEGLFVSAIRHLIARKDARWVHGTWFLHEGRAFFGSLSAEHANLVLDSVSDFPCIDHHVERMLGYIAEQYPGAVWQLFGRRLDRKHESEGDRYEAFPYRFYGLERPLSRDAESAVAVVRSWFHTGDHLFRFEGGRLLSTVFPGFPEPFAARLLDMAENGSDDDVEFVLAVLQNYHGELATHAVLKALVHRLPKGNQKLVEVEISLQATGAVSGEFGMVQALRKKKEEVISWLDDARPPIKAFAAEYIRKLDGRIASEQRSAEQERELRKRNFENDDESDS